MAATKHVIGDRPQNWLVLALCLRVLGIRYDLGPSGLRGTYPDPHAYLLISIAHVDEILIPRPETYENGFPAYFCCVSAKQNEVQAKSRSSVD